MPERRTQILMESFEPSLLQGVERLYKLDMFPPVKPRHVEFQAVVSPLPRLVGGLSTDGKKNKWRRSIELVHIDSLVSKQPYVYRNRVQYYMENPEEIEKPQLHRLRDADGNITGLRHWLVTVFEIDGKLVIGNGNHRVVAAMFLRWNSIQVRMVRPWI